MTIPAHLIFDTQNFDKENTTKSKPPFMFSKEFFATLTDNPKNCGFISANGEAMKPTIEGKCFLLINFADNKLQEGKIYLLSFDTRMLVRRVQLLLDKIVLVADNPDYPNMEIAGEDLNRLKVEGQVKFIGRVL